MSTPNLFQEEFPRLSWTGTPDRCPKCGSAIWKAICRTGFLTYLDTQVITPSQDLEFYLVKRRTYRLWRTGDGWEIDYRDPLLILSDKGDQIALPVHQCDQFSHDWPDYFHRPLPKQPETEEFPF